MDEKEQILYMQTRIIRKASLLWKKSLKETTEVFQKYNLLEYIKRGFELFHMEGDDSVLDSISLYVKNQGGEI